jgi:hypothetical protein
MLISGDDGFGLKDDVFLNLSLFFAGGLQTSGGAMRTNGGGWDLDNAVNMEWGRPVPRGMPLGSAAFAALGGIAGERAVSLEKGSVPGFETSPQLGILLFQTIVIRPERGVLLLDHSDIVTVSEGISFEVASEFGGPNGGNAAQVGTGIPIGALVTEGGFLKAAHDPGWRLV